jgi:hypothetical protein
MKEVDRQSGKTRSGPDISFNGSDRHNIQAENVELFLRQGCQISLLGFIRGR